MKNNINKIKSFINNFTNTLKLPDIVGVLLFVVLITIGLTIKVTYSLYKKDFNVVANTTTGDIYCSATIDSSNSYISDDGYRYFIVNVKNTNSQNTVSKLPIKYNINVTNAQGYDEMYRLTDEVGIQTDFSTNPSLENYVLLNSSQEGDNIIVEILSETSNKNITYNVTVNCDQYTEGVNTGKVLTNLTTFGNTTRKQYTIGAYLDEATYTGYDFQGWYLANNTEVVRTTGYTQTDVINLTSRWQEKVYTIQINNRNATTYETTETYAFYNRALPPISTLPTKTNYTLTGFYSEKDGLGEKFINANGTSAKNWNVPRNGVLYADWSGTGVEITAIPDPSPYSHNGAGSGSYNYPDDGKIIVEFGENNPDDLSRVRYSLYLIATGTYGDWTMLTPYSDISLYAYPDGGLAHIQEIIRRIKVKINRNNITPTMIQSIDNKNNVTFSDLQYGIYFLQMTRGPAGMETIDLLLAVPRRDGFLTVTAMPCYKISDTPTPDTPTPSPRPTATPFETPGPSTPPPPPRGSSNNVSNNVSSTNTKNIIIYYIYSDGEKAADTYSESYVSGGKYSIKSPVIDGYTASILKVEGTMGNGGKEYTVIYTENDEIIEKTDDTKVTNSDQKYILKIVYYNLETQKEMYTYTKEINYGKTYSITSPTYKGLRPAKEKIQGVLTDNATYVVGYIKDELIQ